MKYILFPLLFLCCAGPLHAQRQDNFKKLFGQMEQDGTFNGCVTIVEKGTVIYSRAVGLADLQRKERLTDSSIFALASISKTFIGTAIQQLKERGALRYTDSLRGFFPELPYPGVTIHSLLQHTSGIGDFLYLRGTPLDTGRINTNADIIKILPTAFPAPFFPPDSMMIYSNTNYVLLAAIIEKVTKESLEHYLQKNIFTPAGMNRTYVHHHLTGNILPGCATGYIWSPVTEKYDLPQNRPSGRFLHYFDGIAGPYGISSTTGDMVKFHMALQNGLLVSRKVLEDATQPGKLRNGKKIEYGKGWTLEQRGGQIGMMVYHTGRYGGFKNYFIRYPKKDRVVVLLGNTDDSDMEGAAEAIEQIMAGEPFSIPAQVRYQAHMTLADSIMQNYCGIYRVGTAEVTITREGPVLIFKGPARAEVELYARGSDVFSFRDPELRNYFFRFIRNSDGIVQRMDINLPAGNQSFVKVQ